MNLSKQAKIGIDGQKIGIEDRNKQARNTQRETVGRPQKSYDPQQLGNDSEVESTRGKQRLQNIKVETRYRKFHKGS